VMLLQEVRARGGPYALGRQHGAAVPELIRRVADVRSRQVGDRSGKDLAVVARRSLVFLPIVEQHFPHYVEEVRGLADGAGIPFEMAFFIQVATEMHFIPETQAGRAEGCSAAAAAGPGGAVIGQNWDVPEAAAGKQIILHLFPTQGPEILMFTYAGVIGYIGMNSHGVAHVANQLASPGWQPGIPQYFLKRRFLESRTIDECLDLLGTLPISSAANYVMADASGRVVDIEMAPEGFRVLEGGPRQVHANHFTHPDLLPLERYLQTIPDSLVRHDRLLAVGPMQASVEEFQAVFRDHHNYPESICRHASGDGTLNTVGSVIMDLRARSMYVAPGNPCSVPYQEFRMG